jgi:hypothetical protein
MESGIRWKVRDRSGNEIFLTQERWQHIIEPFNHPEMNDFEKELKQTIRQGKRKQDALNPRKYRYSKAFANLAQDNTHIIAIAIFGFQSSRSKKLIANNFIVTAYQKEIR